MTIYKYNIFILQYWYLQVYHLSLLLSLFSAFKSRIIYRMDGGLWRHILP